MSDDANPTPDNPTPGAGGAGDVGERLRVNDETAGEWYRDATDGKVIDLVTDRETLLAALHDLIAERDALRAAAEDWRELANAVDAELRRAASDYLPNSGDINHARGMLRAVLARDVPAGGEKA
jgi:hypothetical protein